MSSYYICDITLIKRFKRLFHCVRNIGFPATLRYSLIRARLRRDPNLGNLSIHPKGIHFPIFLRGGTSDIDVFYQIFVVGEYEALRGIDASTVLDLGANVGISACWFLSAFPRAKVLCVEPDPDNCRQLQRNMLPYGTRVIVMHAAVSDRKGKCGISADSRGSGNEFGRQIVVSEEGVIPVVTPTDCIGLLGEKVDLIKIDIEGAEERLFQEGAMSWIDAARNIAIEIHTDPIRAQVFERMSDYDYRHAWSHELDLFFDIHRRGGTNV